MTAFNFTRRASAGYNALQREKKVLGYNMGGTQVYTYSANTYPMEAPETELRGNSTE